MNNKMDLRLTNYDLKKDAIDVFDSDQQLKQLIAKEDSGLINLNQQDDFNQKDGLLKKDDNCPYYQRMSILNKQETEKQITEEREQFTPMNGNRFSISFKGQQEQSARGSLKSDQWFGDKSKTRMSIGGNTNQFGSFNRMQKEQSGVNEEPTSFSYTKQPIRMKMKKDDGEQRGSISSEIKQLERIKKRLWHYFQNFTYSGKMKFYEKASVHRTLNDKSDGYLDRKSNFPFSQFFTVIAKKIKILYKNSFLSKIPVINEQDSSTLLLRFMFILYQSIFFLILSIMIVFPNVLTEDEITLYKITLAIWGVEVLIKLNTSTHYHSNIITSRKLILSQYVKKQVISDIIPAVLLIILTSKDSISYQFRDGWNTYLLAQIFVFIKLYTFFQDLSEFQRELCMIMKRYYIVKLVNLIVKLFVIAHIIACMWYLVGKIEMYYLGEGVTWQNKSIAEDQTWWKIYLLTMNWSLTLMTTSQSDGTTVLQIFFQSFTILFTTIITGYIINATGSILVEIDASEENKRNDLNIINDHMRKKNISKNLQNRVNIYLDYYYQKNFQKSAEDIKNVLSKISTELKSSISKEYFYQILSKIDFLHRNYTVSSLQNIAVSCEEVAYFPNQIIFEQNDYSDAALLMITEGTVEIYQSVNQNEQKTICFLGKGNIIGQINFFTGMARTACARSKGFTKIAKITRDAFVEQIKGNEKDIQTFYQMKDNILLYENYVEMNIKCSACQSYNHLQGACSQVHLNKDFIVQSARVSNQIKQLRQDYLRQKQKKFNSKKKLQQVQEKNILFLSSIFDDSQLFTESDNQNEDDYGDLMQGQLNQQNSVSLNEQELRSIVEQEEEEQVSHQVIRIETNQNSDKHKNILKTELSQNDSISLEDNTKQNGNTSDSRLLQNKNSSDSMNLSQNRRKQKIQPNQILPEESIVPQKQEAIKSTFSRQFTKKLTSEKLKKSNSQDQAKQTTQENKKGQTQNDNDDIYDYIEETQGNQSDNERNHTQIPTEMNHSVEKQHNKQSSKDIFYWSFDRQKNYDYYFNHGNAFIKLHQFTHYQKRKLQKQQQQQQSQKLNNNRKSKLSRGSVYLKQRVSQINAVVQLMQTKINK